MFGVGLNSETREAARSRAGAPPAAGAHNKAPTTPDSRLPGGVSRTRSVSPGEGGVR